jgi:hypothetical protein
MKSQGIMPALPETARYEKAGLKAPYPLKRPEKQRQFFLYEYTSLFLPCQDSYP